MQPAPPQTFISQPPQIQNPQPYVPPQSIAPQPTPQPIAAPYIPPQNDNIQSVQSVIQGDVDVAPIVAEVMRRIENDPRYRGRDGTNGRDGVDGRNGIDGKDGANGRDAEVTDRQLAAVTASVLQMMQSDPKYRGPQGPPGATGVNGKDAEPIDEEALAKRILRQLPDIEVTLNGGEPVSQSLSKAAASNTPARFEFDLRNQANIQSRRQ